MDKCVESHKLLKLSKGELENLNRPIINEEVKLVIKKFPKEKAQLSSLLNFTKYLKDN